MSYIDQEIRTNTNLHGPIDVLLYHLIAICWLTIQHRLTVSQYATVKLMLICRKRIVHIVFSLHRHSIKVNYTQFFYKDALYKDIDFKFEQIKDGKVSESMD